MPKIDITDSAGVEHRNCRVIGLAADYLPGGFFREINTRIRLEQAEDIAENRWRDLGWKNLALYTGGPDYTGPIYTDAVASMLIIASHAKENQCMVRVHEILNQTTTWMVKLNNQIDSIVALNIGEHD